MEEGSVLGVLLSVGELSGRSPGVAVNGAQHLQCSQGSNIGLDLFDIYGWEERPWGCLVSAPCSPMVQRVGAPCSCARGGSGEAIGEMYCESGQTLAQGSCEAAGAHTSAFRGHLENALSILLYPPVAGQADLLTFLGPFQQNY